MMYRVKFYSGVEGIDINFEDVDLSNIDDAKKFAQKRIGLDETEVDWDHKGFNTVIFLEPEDSIIFAKVQFLSDEDC